MLFLCLWRACIGYFAARVNRRIFTKHDLPALTSGVLQKHQENQAFRSACCGHEIRAPGTGRHHLRALPECSCGFVLEAAGKQLNFHTVGQKLEDRLQNTKPNVKPRTFERYRGTITDFLGDRKTAALTSIVPEDMISFGGELSWSGPSFVHY